MKMSLTKKLITGFAVVATLTAAVGAVGWIGLSSTSGSLKVMGDHSIPALMALDKVKMSLLEIKVIQRTLFSPYLSEMDYARQFQLLDAARAVYKQSLESYDKTKRTAEEEKYYQKFLVTLADVKKLNDEYFKVEKELKESSASSDEMVRKLTTIAMEGGLREKYDELMVEMQALLDYMNGYYAVKISQDSIRQSTILNSVIIGVALIGFALSWVLGIFLSRSITKPVIKITSDLFNASKSLESASLQVSSSSQELSSGSSELASSIEEMTSSLEELQSIIESNTKNVNQSEMLMRETSNESNKVSERMGELKGALNEISDNSKKISKIIKVIDDIAFQTNILALNAAVEAARAGDAGKGFAVVADQVKSLAQKSADAAKETADLIERAIDSVAKGEQLGTVAIDAQAVAVDKASKVATLLDEVNRASKEQLKGANQITQGVSQVNSVVQATAASSEENAAAGEELLSQAESLRGNVNDLNYIIQGDSGKNPQARESSARHRLPDGNTLAYTPSEGHEGRGSEPSAHSAQGETVTGTMHGHIEVIKPEDKIPMHDFKDF